MYARVGIVGLVLLLLLLWLASDVILITFAGILVAIGLSGLSRQLEQLSGRSYHVSLSILLIAVAMFVAGLAWWRGPPIADEFQRLAQEVPSAAESLYEKWGSTGWGNLLVQMAPDLQQLQNGDLSSILGRLSSMLTSTFGAMGSLFVILAIGVYGGLESRLYLDAATRLAPPDKRHRTREVLHAIRRGLSWWLLGRFSSMAVVGVLTWIGLVALGVPLALSLGIIAGLFAFVPNIGPVLSVVPALLIASSQSSAMTLYVLLLYIGVQTVESYFITPFIQKKAVRLPPAMLIAMQVILGSLFGLLGLVFATPLTVTGIILVQTLYIQDVLGDQIALMGEHPENERAEGPAAR